MALPLHGFEVKGDPYEMFSLWSLELPVRYRRTLLLREGLQLREAEAVARTGEVALL